MDTHQQIGLEDAVEKGDLDRAARLLEAGADASASCHALDNPVLDIALRNGDEAMARLLVDHGAQLGEKDADGRTRLHRAAGEMDGSGLLTLLLALGSDMNARDAQGWSPLHFAAAYGYASNVAVLLAAGAERTPRNRTGLRPRDVAMENEHVAVAELLDAR